jgi:hypothetical protein
MYQCEPSRRLSRAIQSWYHPLPPLHPGEASQRCPVPRAWCGTGFNPTKRRHGSTKLRWWCSTCFTRVKRSSGYTEPRGRPERGDGPSAGMAPVAETDSRGSSGFATADLRGGCLARCRCGPTRSPRFCGFTGFSQVKRCRRFTKLRLWCPAGGSRVKRITGFTRVKWITGFTRVKRSTAFTRVKRISGFPQRSSPSSATLRRDGKRAGLRRGHFGLGGTSLEPQHSA